MASRNLGSLTIDLVAKTGGFTAGLSKAERELDSRGKRMNAIAKKIGTGIGVAISAGVAAGGVLATSLKVSIDRMDELSKSAQRAQLPTEQFSQLAYAGSLADVAMEDITKSLGKLAKAQGDAAQGLKTQVRGFEALGIAFKEADGSLRPTYEVFLDFADTFQKHRGSPEIMALGMQVFGRSFQNLIPLLKDGRAGLEAAADEADRLGITLSTEAGQQAEEFNDNLTRLKTSLAGISQTIAAELLPDLIKLTEKTLKWITEGDQAKQIAIGIADELKKLGEFAYAAKEGLDALASTRTALGELEGVLARLTPQGITGIGERVRNALPQWLYQEIAGEFSNVRGSSSTLRNNQFFNVSGGSDTVSGNQPLTIQPPTSGGGKKQLTEEEKAAEQLKRAYESLTESMRERIALFGEETEVAKVTYEIQHGSLKALDEASKQSLLTQAAELDALRERQEIEEEGKRLIEGLLQPFEQVNAERKRAVELLEAGVIAQEDYNRAIAALKTPAEEMLADIEFQAELLGKTSEEQARMTAALYLGAEAFTAQGQAAIQAAGDFEVYSKAMQEQIQFIDGFRNEASNLFSDLVSGSKSAKEAFTDFFDSIADMITRMIANRWIEQLFGQQGTTGAGTSGGGWISAILGAFGFGGGRASGGWASPNTAYEVNERGFEMATVRGRDFLLTGNSPVQITPNDRLGLGGGPVQLSQQFVVAGRMDSRTADQMAAQAGTEARRALTRSRA